VVQDAGHGREAATQREIEEQGLQHFVLGGEVIVDGHARGAGALGDRVDRECGHALLRAQTRARGGEELGPRVGRRLLPFR